MATAKEITDAEKISMILWCAMSDDPDPENRQEIGPAMEGLETSVGFHLFAAWNYCGCREDEKNPGAAIVEVQDTDGVNHEVRFSKSLFDAARKAVA